MKKNRLILIAILILAFALRFWKLSSFPALNADEAALGYNAWSLIKTGLDEHGNSWPIHLQSFNDYKPALYAYLTMPIIAFHGLTIISVRIAGAFLGVLTVLAVYLLAKEMGKSENFRKLGKNIFPLIAAFFIAISPWHIHFSRGGWEVNVATFFVTIGIWLILKWTNIARAKDYSKFSLHSTTVLTLGVSAFILSLYTYHAARVIVPLLGIGFFVLFWKKIVGRWRSILAAGVVGLILVIPLVNDLAGPAGLSRAAGVGIFSDPGPLNEINEQRGEHSDLRGMSARALHNKPINYALAFAENWVEHFSGEFLFLSGDEIQRNKVPEHGQMYLIDLLFVVLGFVAVTRVFDKRWALILWWLSVAPVAAALTFQSPHALRSQNMVIPLVLISAYGFTYSISWFRKSFKSKYVYGVWCAVCGFLILWGFSRYQHHYWIHMPNAYPFSSQYGVDELIRYVDQEGEKYETIVITDRYDQPYILTLFYLQYPPEKFQTDHELTAPDGYGFSTVRSFDKYRFHSVEWPATPDQYDNSLIAGTDEEIPAATNIVKTIEFPSGETAFEIVAN